FFDAAKASLAQVQEVPVLMRLAMLILAVLCVVMSLLVLGGLANPFLIGPAATALLGGVFSL
ncbi:hypothetical protein ACFLQR_04875, partial [Verrucomicrobiota bacterium]